ncbi:MAG: hypothetical protein K9L78_01065, partial [Victivallales bacterium]|nr:hypothetical protein [Victivallales bacterium]
MPVTVRLFRGGVHPKEGKELSCSEPIRTAPLLDKYTVILHQHIGAPPKLLVKNKDKVRKGQVIAEKAGFVSASVHSPTSGTVKLVNCHGPAGSHTPAVEI